MADRETELQYAADECAIREVLARYCRGIDRLDLELLKSVYHPDAYDDHGSFRGNAIEFAEMVIPALRSFDATMHTLGQSHIEVAGDVAHAESYVVAYHRIGAADAARLQTFGGRYVDRLEKRDGEWRIAHRVVIHEWSSEEPVKSPYPVERFAAGRRDRSDLSYELVERKD